MQDRSKGRTGTNPAATRYLVLYNTLCAAARTTILVSAVYLWYTQGSSVVWDKLNVPVRWVEALTALEFVHAVAGLVRAAPATTALQVAGRNTVVWAITRNYPGVAAQEWAYSSMLVAWNAADAVRYAYFAMDRGLRAVPGMLSWLKFNLFIVLYPIGILSEARLAYAVIEPSRARNPAYQYLLWFGLALYPPAFYILYGHMFAQRRKASQMTTKKRE